jgi:hypothetical protein
VAVRGASRALAMSANGYYVAYRPIYAAEGGYALSRRQLTAMSARSRSWIPMGWRPVPGIASVTLSGTAAESYSSWNCPLRPPLTGSSPAPSG